MASSLPPGRGARPAPSPPSLRPGFSLLPRRFLSHPPCLCGGAVLRVQTQAEGQVRAELQVVEL